MWQQSVETRLGSLDSRLQTLSADVSDIKTDVATIKATMATKGWMVTGLISALAVIGGLIAFAEKLQSLVS